MEMQLPRPSKEQTQERLPSLAECLKRPISPDPLLRELRIKPPAEVQQQQQQPPQRTSAVSIDDPDVRIAAQALGDLRADFVQTPLHRHNTPHSTAIVSSNDHQQRQQQQQHHSQNPTQQPEPLLTLLETSHPLLSTAINGSLSAYSVSKSYSPRFKYGAEFVERHIGSPVASTVGSVGRRTGVEGGVRWWLGGSRRPNHMSRISPSSSQEQHQQSGEGGSSKRRKVITEREHGDYHSEDFDLERGGGFLCRTHSASLPAYSERRLSEASCVESLPAYDDMRSPSYEAHCAGGGALIPTSQSSQQEISQHHQHSSQHHHHPTWQSRLMVSTSGFGVAMSEESLRSLRYCLTWLRWANQHLGKVVVALKGLVEQWDQNTSTSNIQQQRQSGQEFALQDTPKGDIKQEPTTNNTSGSNSTTTSLIPYPQSRDHLAQSIQALKEEVLSTLKKVVDIVSTYAGGALPEHARSFVRHSLNSLPQRFRTAFASSSSTTTITSLQHHQSYVNQYPQQQQQQQYPQEKYHEQGQSDEKRDHALQPSQSQSQCETISSAQRIIVLAKEGLDMMAQVSSVLDATIASAEDWCERLGRKKRGEREMEVDEREGDQDQDRDQDMMDCTGGGDGGDGRRDLETDDGRKKMEWKRDEQEQEEVVMNEREFKNEMVEIKNEDEIR
ncbi:MAG: hypothetical protein M1823_000820 [Watsoniomyces obsoletus]|nr:MAG: hypothetical protein M1823_000820 [Watsoniomyces obsoletus]